MKKNELLYSFHITFEDGSNPYCSFNMRHDTFKKRIRKWMKNYNLTVEKIISWTGSKTIYYHAVACVPGANDWIENLPF